MKQSSGWRLVAAARLHSRIQVKIVDYKFFANLHAETAIPAKGILSRVIQKDESVNITLFGMAAGEEISSHSAPTPAILYFLEGEAMVQLGSDTVQAQLGSFVFMPPQLPHAIAAKSAVRMLLVQIKSRNTN
jgi:quercetin dioxygenase-like cupin family protein